jgi:hypothetical protein
MSKRNQRWGKAIDAIRATGKHGATAIDIGNAVLGTHGISARDREAYGLALGTRLVRLKMATVLANNRFVMTRPDTRDEEKTYADELRNQPFTSMVEAKEQAADRRRRQMAQKQQRLQREACTSKSCFDRTSVSSPIELKRVSFKVDPGQSAKKPKTPIATKMDIPAPAQQSGASDPVLSRATTAVAAKMDDPASIEFEDMKRAIRKDTFGQPIDTICGHVKGKKASGEETGERPFLYVVGENRAFIDDGNPDSLGAIAYRAICINPDLRRQDSRR